MLAEALLMKDKICLGKIKYDLWRSEIFQFCGEYLLVSSIAFISDVIIIIRQNKGGFYFFSEG